MSIVETSTDVVYRTPEELVAFLRTNPPKAKGQLAIGEARCCIGHYADLCGIDYDSSAGGFTSLVRAPEGKPVAPRDHWLFNRAATVDSTRSSFIVTTTHQVNLIMLNDANDTFAEVIDYLENVVIGGREA